MSLLTIIQDACDVLGIPRTNFVVSNTDQSVRQLLGHANRSGAALAQRYAWEDLIREGLLTTVASEDQGAIDTILPGFNWYLYNTQWNRDTRLNVFGALFPSEWQFLKASNVIGAFPNFRIRNKHLYYLPVPPAGQTVGLEYVSKYWCQSAANVPQDRWAADTDTGILSEELLTLDLIWRWKAAKGFEYAEDKAQAEIMINLAIANSGAKRMLPMSGNSYYGDGGNEMFGLRIPDGNWSL